MARLERILGHIGENGCRTTLVDDRIEFIAFEQQKRCARDHDVYDPRPFALALSKAPVDGECASVTYCAESLS